MFSNNCKMKQNTYTPDALQYTRGNRIPRLRGVRNYVNNNFAMYKRLTCSRVRVELVSPGYLGLGIIQIIILPCIHV